MDMQSDQPSDGPPPPRQPDARNDAHAALRSQRWLYPLKCVAALVGITALALFILDHGVLAWIESSDAADAKSGVQLATRNWQQENALIQKNNEAKVLSDPEEWIWRSQAFATTEQRGKTHRILVAGDSFVWGDGYANMNDLWWRQLERELRRRGYRDVEVIGLGACGASTRQQLDRIRKVVPRYRPDLVIWGYVTNDADEGLVKQFDYERLNKDRVIRYHDRGADHGLLRRLNFQLEQRRREKLLHTLPGPKRGYEYSEWEQQLLTPANLVAYATTVREVAAFMSEANTPYFFITLPNSPAEESFRARYAPIKPVFATAGVPFVDVLDDFVAAYPSDTKLSNDLGWGINPANGHPGVVSTRFYAREAADLLEREHASALGPRGAPELSAAPEINDWVPATLAVQQNTTGQIRFEYPLDDTKLLRMPLEQSHVRLHLSMPSNLRELRLAGPGLASATLYVTQVNPDDGIDYGTLASLPEQSGSELNWTLPAAIGELVNTVRVTATFEGDDRSLTLDLARRTQ